MRIVVPHLFLQKSKIMMMKTSTCSKSLSKFLPLDENRPTRQKRRSSQPAYQNCRLHAQSYNRH